MAFTVKSYKAPANLQEEIDKQQKVITNPPKFDYNPLTDLAYQSYAKQYNQLGQQANENTMANVAAQTGGLASSYAVQAGMQAQNQYNQQLSNKIPELERLAYDKYNSNRNYNMSLYDKLNNSKMNDYNIYSHDREAKQRQAQFEAEFKENKRKFNLNHKLDKSIEKFKEMMDKWTTLGYADGKVAAYFGIAKGTRTSDSFYKDAQNSLNNYNTKINETKRARKNFKNNPKKKKKGKIESKITKQKSALNFGVTKELENLARKRFAQ